mgnify:CR=1 FL=1
MFTLISFILTAIFIVVCKKSLKAHPLPYYIIAAVIAVAVFVIQLTGISRSFSPFVNDYIWALFFRGGIAGALFSTVMWTGAVPVRSKRMKQNMPIRGELSILAGILSLGHSAAQGLTYFRLFFTQPSRMSAPTLLFVICSIVMLLVMLPLFITSFPMIRRKMKASSWKKLQRLAYVFYALMFAHVSLLYVPGLIAGRDYWLSYIIYCFVFISYAICRVMKAILKNVDIRMIKVQLVGNALATVMTALVIALIFMASPARQTTAAEEIVSSEQQTVEGAAEESSAESATETETTTVAETETTAAPVPAAKYNDGTYYGTGNGYEGPISLSVTIENDKIAWIEITDSIEDPEYMEPALAIIQDVINAQHTNLDAVTGSTYSSYGILDAVDAALEQARR